MTTRNIFVSSALPYANGPLHMGHVVEYVQSDIWARFQKQRGHNCTYVCAADAHGTPIMITARQQGITPEQLIERVSAEQHEDLKAFGVAFDNFHTTHSDENELIVRKMYTALHDAGYIYTKIIEQAYDETEKMFLASYPSNCCRQSTNPAVLPRWKSSSTPRQSPT